MAGTRAPTPPAEQPLLAQLIDSLHKDKFKLSKEESEVLAKCSGRIKLYGVEGFVAAGTSVWAVTGSLNLPQRLIATLAGATGGGTILMRWASGICMKDILALDGSPLQERFAAILQKEALRRPHIRSLLEKHYYVEPLYDDSGQNTPRVLLRKRESADVGFQKSFKEEDHSGEDSDPPQNVNKASTTPNWRDQPAPNESEKNTTVDSLKVHGSTYAHTHDEASDDPFDMLLGSEPKDEESSKKFAIKGKHNGKIGVLERRERNRARYLEWQEKRSGSGWGDTLTEL